jgi:hypothetical protein
MENHISSKSNINPKIWGPHFWKTFHLIAFGYPLNPNEKDKYVYKKFYKYFSNILPCDKCSLEARKLNEVINWDLILKNRENLIRWTYDYHDTVNQRLGKTSPNFEKFLKNFIKDVNNFVCYCDRTIEYTIIGLLLLFLLIFIMHYTSNTP